MMPVSKALKLFIAVSSPGLGVIVLSLSLEFSGLSRGERQQRRPQIAPVCVAGAAGKQRLDRGDLRELGDAGAGGDDVFLGGVDIGRLCRISMVAENERQVGCD